MKYYIYNNAKIKIREQQVDTSMFTQFVEMTDEQISFYLQNPNASIEEIKNCKLLPIPPLPTLEEVKEGAIKELSDYSLETGEKVVPSYKVQNAQITLLGNVASAIYTIEEAQDIVSFANEIGKQCRILFYESKARIENCDSLNAVYDIVTEVKNEYDIIARDNETTI